MILELGIAIGMRRYLPSTRQKLGEKAYTVRTYNGFEVEPAIAGMRPVKSSHRKKFALLCSRCRTRGLADEGLRHPPYFHGPQFLGMFI